MLFFETTCIERRDPIDSFQSDSGVEKASVHRSILAQKIDSTIRSLQRAGRGERGKMILSGEMIPLNDDRMVSAI
jgi:hypothetical protein